MIQPAAPNITWDASPNFWPGRSGRQPLAIVMHIEAGTEAGTDAWFANVKSQVSAHFSIAKTGEIRQHVQETDSAWANGAVAGPDLSIPWLKEAVEAKVNPNFLTISIEHEGYPDQPMPAAQTAASLALTAYLCARHNIPADADHIIGHCKIDSVDRGNCPGPTFPFRDLIEKAAAILNPPAPAPAPDPAPAPAASSTPAPDHRTQVSLDGVTCTIDFGCKSVTWS